MDGLPDHHVDLIVTSPPYPMIEMWDDMFFKQNPDIKTFYRDKDISLMFESMHNILDRVWAECFRVLKKGGFLCINIGDATRTVYDNFHLFPNHARILHCLTNLGLTILPAIIWRKQTNAPNKFMGSGMLPAGAYVTLEHEYILIARKGGKREFITAREKENRQESAFFWEERNMFFSDVWMDVKGTRQHLGDQDARKRSAAFPFEVAYRLINMYSVKGDMVLDPFWGTGTTSLAAAVAARNSTGYEIDAGLSNIFSKNKAELVSFSKVVIDERLDNHVRFVEARIEKQKPLKHQNVRYGFPVITNQEKNLFINPLDNIVKNPANGMTVVYAQTPQKRFDKDWDSHHNEPLKEPDNKKSEKRASKKAPQKKEGGFTQMELF